MGDINIADSDFILEAHLLDHRNFRVETRDLGGLRIGGFRATLWDRNVASPSQFDEAGRGVNLLSVARPDPSIAQANALTTTATPIPRPKR